jgi:hypothetical protein
VWDDVDRRGITTPDAMNNVEMQVWLGLRVLANQCCQPIPFRPASLERALRLWRDIDQRPNLSESYHALNGRIIEWLERCRSNGAAYLVADPSRLTATARLVPRPRSHHP